MLKQMSLDSSEIKEQRSLIKVYTGGINTGQADICVSDISATTTLAQSIKMTINVNYKLN
jgi:hypothetical protein